MSTTFSLDKSLTMNYSCGKCGGMKSQRRGRRDIPWRERLSHPDYQGSWKITGINICRLRQNKKGWTVQEFADRFPKENGEIGCNPSHISNIEKGNKFIGGKQILKLAELFEVNIEELYRTYDELPIVIKRMSTILKLIADDPRYDLIPILNGIITVYSRKLPQTEEISAIIKETARPDWGKKETEV